MAYSGPPDWDEFDDESIAAFWTGLTENAGATATETADGYLTIDFIAAPGASQRVYMDQYAGDGYTPVPSGTAWEYNERFYLPPIPYNIGDLDYGDNHYDNEVGWRYWEWGLWDENVYHEARLTWVHGATPWGNDMVGHESCYTFEVSLVDEGQSVAEVFGPSWMTDRGVDNVIEVIADENHNGWFTFRFSIDASGNQKFYLQPDNGDVLDLTPLAAVQPYNFNYGGKGGWGWGISTTYWEQQGGGYTGDSPGPIYLDWIRETYEWVESWPVPTGISSTLHGEAVEIAEKVIERYGNYVVYIDSSGVLKIKDSSITDFSTDVPIAVSASHL